MSSQIYLDLTVSGDSVSGNAVHALYEQTIELQNFKWSMATKEASGQNRHSVTPSVEYKEVTCTKSFDVASPRLLNLMRDKTLIDSADLWVEDQLINQDTKSDNTLLLIQLKNAWISKISNNMSESNSAASIKEDITLRYESMTLTYCWAPKTGGARSISATFRSPKNPTSGGRGGAAD